jgi:uncharacterized protein YkvS
MSVLLKEKYSLDIQNVALALTTSMVVMKICEVGNILEW